MGFVEDEVVQHELFKVRPAGRLWCGTGRDEFGPGWGDEGAEVEFCDRFLNFELEGFEGGRGLDQAADEEDPTGGAIFRRVSERAD